LWDNIAWRLSARIITYMLRFSFLLATSLLVASTGAGFADDLADCRSGKSDGAVEACERAFASGLIDEGEAAVAHRVRGNLHFRAGEFERAATSYTAFLQHDPDNPGGHVGRALVYQRMGDFGRAIADFSDAIRLDPHNPGAFVGRGFSYFKLGDCERAIPDFSVAIALKPQDSIAYNNRGRCYVETKQYDLAMADLNEAVSRSPQSPNPFKNRALVHELKDEFAEAIGDLHVALALDPGLVEAKDTLQRVQQKLNANAAPELKRGRFVEKPRTFKDPELAAIESKGMVFYVARGEPDACGPGCSEWIAASGRFDTGSTERLRALLRRLSGRKLPIYFHSPGGFTQSGMELGRLLRARGMTAGVGRTVPDACRSVAEDACREITRSGQILTARLFSDSAYCHSACGFALIGAQVRLVPPAAQLGVHVSKAVSSDGRIKKVSQLTPAEQARNSKVHASVRGYIREMGIDGALFDMFVNVPSEHLRYLNREELAQFGIDRRKFLESRWELLQSQPATIVKLVVEVDERSGKEFRKTLVRLVCGGAGRILVGYIRSVSSLEIDTAPTVRLTAGSNTVEVQNARYYTTISQLALARYVEGQAKFTPIDFFSAVTSEPKIQIIGADPSIAVQEPSPTLSLSVAGLLESLAQLQRSCK
jgi:Tfp pilus assembly protein PilF